MSWFGRRRCARGRHVWEIQYTSDVVKVLDYYLCTIHEGCRRKDCEAIQVTRRIISHKKG